MKKMLLVLLLTLCPLACVKPAYGPSANKPQPTGLPAHYTFLTKQLDGLLDIVEGLVDKVLSGKSPKNTRADIKKVMQEVQYILSQLLLFKKQMSNAKFSTLVVIIKLVNKLQEVILCLQSIK